MAFSGNTKIPEGAIIKPFSMGSARVALQRFATRYPASFGSHKAEVNNNFHNGTPILVSGSSSATSAPAAASSIHVADLSALDEVYLWASNIGEAAAQITVSFVSGGAAGKANLRDGGATGTELIQFRSIGTDSQSDGARGFPDEGILFKDGAYVTFIVGTMDLMMFYHA